ncbi:hypothetical protein CWD08_25635 [Salmonella enterica]|nr:hypothetical protein [Salmonella enterica]
MKYSGDLVMQVGFDANGDGAIDGNDHNINMNDVAIAAIDNPDSTKSLKTNVTFSNSTLTGNVLARI